MLNWVTAPLPHHSHQIACPPQQSWCCLQMLLETRNKELANNRVLPFCSSSPSFTTVEARKSQKSWKYLNYCFIGIPSCALFIAGTFPWLPSIVVPFAHCGTTDTQAQRDDTVVGWLAGPGPGWLPKRYAAVSPCFVFCSSFLCKSHYFIRALKITIILGILLLDDEYSI